MTIDLEEMDRQMILLAIGILSLQRPGWNWTLGRLADILKGRDMFEQFRVYNKHRCPMEASIHGRCQVCGCTDADCLLCIEKTGEPCSWVNEEHTLCSACV